MPYLTPKPCAHNKLPDINVALKERGKGCRWQCDDCGVVFVLRDNSTGVQWELPLSSVLMWVQER